LTTRQHVDTCLSDHSPHSRRPRRPTHSVASTFPDPPEFHHIPVVFPSQKVPPHPGVTSRSGDIILRSHLQFKIPDFTTNQKFLITTTKIFAYNHVSSPSYIEDVQRHCIQGGQLWTMKRFSACDPNDPALIIIVVTTNLHVEIMEKPRQFLHHQHFSTNKPSPPARNGAGPSTQSKLRIHHPIPTALVNSRITVNFPPRGFSRFEFPRKNLVSLLSPFLCCDYYFALTY